MVEMARRKEVEVGVERATQGICNLIVQSYENDGQFSEPWEYEAHNSSYALN